MLIEDYALIGDLNTAALVGRNGSIDWLCLPRYDAGACFAALLGDQSHGCWRISPTGEVRGTSRRYRDGTLVLETDFETEDGSVQVIDCMHMGEGPPTVVRVVKGLSGRVPMRMRLAIRFDYGSTIPWVQRAESGIQAVAGPDALHLRSRVEVQGEDLSTVAEFAVREGEIFPFTLAWSPSHEPVPDAIDAVWAMRTTTAWWERWSETCQFHGEARPEVVRSLITLKALTYGPTGAIVAAPTTSLPEEIGGVRNWDYRYCWLRDAALTLDALLLGGYVEEALAFSDWLQRATASHPSQTQVLYGISGERRLPEQVLDWLPGYEGSSPVRVGNAAAEQFQLDIVGELLDAAHRGREHTARIDPSGWRRQLTTLEYLEEIWRRPDDGIWEVRGPQRHFTHSKMMAWVAFDRAIRAVERFDAEGPVDRWRSLRDEIHTQICREGYDRERRTFTQYYGSRKLDATALLIPAFGFLPPDDERVLGTIEAIERELVVDGLVLRYSPSAHGEAVDGLAGREGAFLPCSFWLADALFMVGRTDDAQRLFERLLGLANDVGLFSEEYDAANGRMLGNFPQAFTHLALINTASILSGAKPMSRPAGPTRSVPRFAR